MKLHFNKVDSLAIQIYKVFINTCFAFKLKYYNVFFYNFKPKKYILIHLRIH